MATNELFRAINERAALDKDEGDQTYLNALVIKMEFLTKVVVSGIVSCIGDDVDRHRYSLQYRLVRADSLGEWIRVLNSVLSGPPAQVLLHESRSIAGELTKKVGSEDWRHIALICLREAAIELGVTTSSLKPKVALRDYFELGVQLRNRTRGHGAPTATQCSNACSKLETSLQLVMENTEILQLQWVYLHRNLSGKYRVTPLTIQPSAFDFLKSTVEHGYKNGVYFALGNNENTSFCPVPLIFTDSQVNDIYLPNGNYKDKGQTFESLSYATNSTLNQDGAYWSNPPMRLPPSETEGGSNLDVLGNTFTNSPTASPDYIKREDPENSLIGELLKADRHPIITLTGPGGIGKTSITIAAIHEISNYDPAPYEVILWISARDIDLLDGGPKPVSQKVFTQKDISRAVLELLEINSKSIEIDSEQYFQQCLTEGTAGTTLFVLDNFETLQNPSDVVTWIDTYVRLPNKVLITTRFRDFLGDYPIEIGGMSSEESNHLIDRHADHLGVYDLIGEDYKRSLISESNGHPYVMKILLGEVAKERKCVRPKRIFASSDDLLKALFERTFAALSPSSQQIFLLLCSWRVFVPEIAVAAVTLQSGSRERINAEQALDELYRFSLVERVVSDEDKAIFVGVPLSATIFGRTELNVSPYKVAVEEDRKLLMEFGAGKKSNAHIGVFPRIEKFFQSVARRTSNNPQEFDTIKPVLEYLAQSFPKAYLLLTDLILEIGDNEQSFDSAKRYVRQFLQTDPTVGERCQAWMRLATLCRSSNDARGEIHAYCEAAQLQPSNLNEISNLANTLNFRIKELKDSEETNLADDRRIHIEKVIEIMEKQLKSLSATDCSRLAWLYLNVSNRERAYDVAQIGLERDYANEHCLKIIESL